MDTDGINPTITNSAQETVPAAAAFAAQAQLVHLSTQPTAPSALGEQAAAAGSSATKAASAFEPSPKQVGGCMCYFGWRAIAEVWPAACFTVLQLWALTPGNQQQNCWQQCLLCPVLGAPLWAWAAQQVHSLAHPSCLGATGFAQLHSTVSTISNTIQTVLLVPCCPRAAAKHPPEQLLQDPMLKLGPMLSRWLPLCACMTQLKTGCCR